MIMLNRLRKKKKKMLMLMMRRRRKRMIKRIKKMMNEDYSKDLETFHSNKYQRWVIILGDI